MEITVENIEKNIAYCGLVCRLCNECTFEKCSGCKNKSEFCSIKACCLNKGIKGCWECADFPCDEKIFDNKRIFVFVNFAKDYGIKKLSYYLKKNYDKGIHYHKEDGSKGDYDLIENEEKMKDFLMGNIDPYEKCPVYETENFIFRLIEKNDAKFLLKCYSDNESRKIFNSDNCTSDFYYNTIEEMEECLNFWIEQYKEKYFVRFSILEKINKEAIGTIEIFTKELENNNYGKIGMLRIDLLSDFETENFIEEITDKIIDNFYTDFKFDILMSKVNPYGKIRKKIFENKGFIEEKNLTLYDFYYIRKKQKIKF
jgi:RimJ/RimL family protein N-acetyltransferase